MVERHDINPLPEKVAAIHAFPRPWTVGQLMSYLGMVNFYRRFIKGAAGVLKPLTDALRRAPQMLQAFEGSNQQIVAAIHLAHPRKKPSWLCLSMPLAGTHIGAPLQQEVSPGSLQTLGFFSRKLNTTEQKYSTFDRELLAMYTAIWHYRWALEGRRLYVLSDHKLLTSALHRQSDAWSALHRQSVVWSARQQWHLSYVAQYT